MNDRTTPPIDPAQDDVKRDDPMIAAEYALGLLEGEELLAARGRLATDETFAARKQWWDDWFVPLSDEVGGAEPSADLWSRIEAEISAPRGSGNVATASFGGAANPHVTDRSVVDLKSRLRRWQWTAGITSAAAAVALAVLVFSPGDNPGQPQVAAPQVASVSEPLMATVPVGDTGLRLDVTYLPESDRMLVTALGLTADGVHDHELWLVPNEGDVQSLGVVKPGEVMNVALPEDVARNILDGSEVLLTREPLGGKPDGKDPGPVVAEGAFSKV